MAAPHDEAPLPILTGSDHPFDAPEDFAGNWRHAPRAVRYAYVLDITGAILAGLVATRPLAGIADGEMSAALLLTLLASGSVMGLNMVTAIGIRTGTPNAWRTQRRLSVGSLLTVVGLAPHAALLAAWHRPAVRAWFVPRDDELSPEELLRRFGVEAPVVAESPRDAETPRT